MAKNISMKHFKSLNAKSNQVGLNTSELLQVIKKMMTSDKAYEDWKNGQS